MSLERVILVLAAKHMNENKHSEKDNVFKPPAVPVHGVNVVLGGAMMSGIITMVFLICYCCHRNQQKRQNNVQRYWRDPDLPLEIYTVEGQQFFDVSEDLPRAIVSGPPPPYEAVVNEYHHKDLNAENVHVCNDNAELPSYEAAIRLAHNEGRLL